VSYLPLAQHVSTNIDDDKYGQGTEDLESHLPLFHAHPLTYDRNTLEIMSLSPEKEPGDRVAAVLLPENGQVDAEMAHEYIIDPAAEARLVRKQDLRVLPMVFVMYFFTFLDRSNLGNARVAGMETDLGLGAYGFNIGACLYYAIYFLVDLPASLSVKRYGNLILPISCIAFGLITLCTAFIQNQASFFVIRLLLGITESFQVPGLSYVISRFYRRGEVTTRISFFMLASAGLSSGFGGLFASGLLSVGSIGSVSSWRNIFLVEGYVSSFSPLFLPIDYLGFHINNVLMIASSQSVWGLSRYSYFLLIPQRHGSSPTLNVPWLWHVSFMTSQLFVSTRRRSHGNWLNVAYLTSMFSLGLGSIFAIRLLFKGWQSLASLSCD
jgi:MFS family permease